MKTILLKAEARKETGSVATKEIRNAGMVPCVIYGIDEPVHFSVYEADFKNLVYTPNVYKVRIELDGKHHEAILQDMQFHPVSENIMHADFLGVKEDKPVVMEIPVRLIGNSPGVRNGGKLVKKLNRLRCKGLIANFPDFIEVSIETLKIGMSVRVTEIELPKLTLLDAKENAIVSVRMARAVVIEDEEAEGEADAAEGDSAEGGEGAAE
jgi:large subunit ribosomal protein L25